MQLLTIEDPRDKLEKATRFELADFANANGLTDVSCEMPAPMIRKILRAKGLTNINIPDRPLGLYVGKGGDAVVDSMIASGPSDGSVDADDLLAAEYERQKSEKSDPANMTVGQLRAECKRRGLKLSRNDTMQTMREKLGKDTP